jgi:hypothetical protein
VAGKPPLLGLLAHVLFAVGNVDAVRTYRAASTEYVCSLTDKLPEASTAVSRKV